MRFKQFTLAVLAVFTFAGFTTSVLAQDTAQGGPEETVKKVANDLLKDLESRRAELKKDPAALRRLVDTTMLPHFDTEYAARLVLGKYWRDATPEQRKRFIDGFYKSLLDNYGQALLEFTAQNLVILPYRGDASSVDATVKTNIKRSNGQAIPVNFFLHKTPSGWKAWDVQIEGISYVRSYKNDFGGEIERNGLEAVIKKLESGQAPVGPHAQKNAA